MGFGYAQTAGGPSEIGGSGEIRTHGWLAPSPVFKTGALNRSATLPCKSGAHCSGFGRFVPAGGNPGRQAAIRIWAGLMWLQQGMSVFHSSAKVRP
jgi:hypothetical protein